MRVEQAVADDIERLVVLLEPGARIVDYRHHARIVIGTLWVHRATERDNAWVDVDTDHAAKPGAQRGSIIIACARADNHCRSPFVADSERHLIARANQIPRLVSDSTRITGMAKIEHKLVIVAVDTKLPLGPFERW